MKNDLEFLDLNIPKICEFCEHTKLKYIGVGEYECEECQHIMYDDYGRVRNYIEKHPGATQNDVSRETGVSTNTIRRLLKEDRIQIAPGSAMFLHCENCGTNIRSGRLCDSCLKLKEASENRAKKPRDLKHITGGFIRSEKKESGGAKRFTR